MRVDYDDQADKQYPFFYQGVGPTIAYDRGDGLYYFTYGPMNTPGKRNYPQRIWNGELDGSQPDTFYTTTQLPQFSPIISALSTKQFFLPKEAIGIFPTPPFYCYFIFSLEDYRRITKIENDLYKTRVEAIDWNTGLVTVRDDVSLQIPLFNTPEYAEYCAHPIMLAYYKYPIENLVNSPLVILPGDAAYYDIEWTNSFSLINVTGPDRTSEGHNTLTLQAGEDYEFPALPYDCYIVQTDPETGQVNTLQKTSVTAIDQADGFSYLTINPSIFFATAGDTYSEFVPSALQETPNISDDELSVPLPGTQWSLRPHSYHILNPLQAYAYADIGTDNWAKPFPYPEATFQDDCVPAIRKGFQTPYEFKNHMLHFSRYTNQWSSGGADRWFCICRSFTQSLLVREAFIEVNKRILIKMQDDNPPRAYQAYRRLW